MLWHSSLRFKQRLYRPDTIHTALAIQAIEATNSSGRMLRSDDRNVAFGAISKLSHALGINCMTQGGELNYHFLDEVEDQHAQFTNLAKAHYLSGFCRRYEVSNLQINLLAYLDVTIVRRIFWLAHPPS